MAASVLKATPESKVVPALRSATASIELTLTAMLGKMGGGADRNPP